jgi:hypothetical protein
MGERATGSGLPTVPENRVSSFREVYMKALKKAFAKTPKPKETTVDEAISIAKQLRPDQGVEKLLAFLEKLKK